MIGMDIIEAKISVIEAGHRLLSEGLIARTWGNVSCRVDDSHFVITPSGRDYVSLTPEDIVIVSTDDLSYEGDIKPSSEKGIHAECYKLRPDCNFVIHTHQMYASVAGIFGSDINVISDSAKKTIGLCVPCAPYGLPGTSKLRSGVSAAVEYVDSKAVLMQHHGAVCLGVDMDDAFKVALELERVCVDYLLQRHNSLLDDAKDSFSSLCEYVSSLSLSEKKEIRTIEPYDSSREGDTFVMKKAGEDKLIRVELSDGSPVCNGEELPESSELHRQIYLKYPKINDVIHSESDAQLAVSRIAPKKIRPLLDDFAQIVGVSMRRADFDPDSTLKTARKSAKKLRGRNAAILKNNGVICVASDRDDAEAVEMITDKQCRCYVASRAVGQPADPISSVESLLMRVIYSLKYSKLK